MIKCIINNCENIVEVKKTGLCTKHRQRWKKYKSYDLPEKNPLPVGILKICKIHGELQKDEVSKRKNSPYHQCKECKSKHTNQWRKYNPQRNKLHRFKNHLKKKFSLSLNEYELLINKQNFLCKICKKYSNNKKLSIDHCHKTNKIRGLLCHKCNTGIGLFYDSIELLQSAIDYLKASI